MHNASFIVLRAFFISHSAFLVVHCAWITVNAYLDALRMLARRELSEVQIRQRLARRRHPAYAIDEAVARLLDERAIDDRRVAEAIARTQSSVKRRGKLRVRRELEQAGISRDTARTVVDHVFESVNTEAQLQASLDRRLRGRDLIADDKEFARLYRYLIGQGFEVDLVLRALRARQQAT